VENASNEIKQHIFIDQNTKIKGIICYLQNKNKANLEPQIMLKEHALLEGFLFCEQQLELLGNVHGSVYTKGFITKQFGAIYQNHIYNGEISNTALMEEFVDFPLENLDTKVMKWLY
jgi:cytoskeletal protein CcmA (bactofilin family)